MATEDKLDALAGLVWKLRSNSEKLQRYYEAQHEYDSQVADKLKLINDHRRALGYPEFDLLAALDDYLEAIGEYAEEGNDFWECRRRANHERQDLSKGDCAI